MCTHRGIAAAVTATGALAVAGGAAKAQTAAPAPFAAAVSAGAVAVGERGLPSGMALFDRPGIYVYVPDPGQGLIIERAVNRAVARMLPVIRAIARQRLMRTNELPDTLRLIVGPDTLGTQVRRDKPMTLPRSGVMIRWDDGRGNVCRARDSVAADTLLQFCRVGTAASVARYVPGADGRALLMTMHVTSPRLSGPVDYRIAFRRVE